MKFYFSLLVLLFCSTYALSQASYEGLKTTDSEFSVFSQTSVQKSSNKFLDNFALGIKGGVNFSMLMALQPFTVFSGQAPETYKKEYESLTKNMGMQMGFILMYDISPIIKISLQPSMNEYIYKYKNTYEWAGKSNLQSETAFTHSVRFFEVPLILGFYTTYNSFQPYFQTGLFYGKLLGADSQMKVSETNSNLGTSSKKLEYETSAYTAELYAKQQYGALLGAGISYLTGNMRIGLEANYRFMISDLNTIETQYMSNQVVSGSYDVPDKFKFTNIAVNLNLIVLLSSSKQASRSSGGGYCPSYD